MTKMPQNILIMGHWAHMLGYQWAIFESNGAMAHGPPRKWTLVSTSSDSNIFIFYPHLPTFTFSSPYTHIPDIYVLTSMYPHSQLRCIHSMYSIPLYNTHSQSHVSTFSAHDIFILSSHPQHLHPQPTSLFLATYIHILRSDIVIPSPLYPHYQPPISSFWAPIHHYIHSHPVVSSLSVLRMWIQGQKM